MGQLPRARGAWMSDRLGPGRSAPEDSGYLTLADARSLRLARL
jgi:hypothetical protein